MTGYKCQVRHETPEEGRGTYRPKRRSYNNKDEVNSPNILSNEDKISANSDPKWLQHRTKPSWKKKNSLK